MVIISQKNDDKNDDFITKQQHPSNTCDNSINDNVT